MPPRLPSSTANSINSINTKDSMNSANSSSHTSAERIELKDPFAAQVWAKKFNVSPEQLREAIEAVGDQAPQVEMHLKGSRSTTNADRVKSAGGDKPR